MGGAAAVAREECAIARCTCSMQRAAAITLTWSATEFRCNRAASACRASRFRGDDVRFARKTATDAHAPRATIRSA
jgi:hypothetical protein